MSASWTLDKAMFARWQAHQLDATFRQYWSNPADLTQLVLHDSEARPNTPMPYCVYERGSGLKTGESTGGPCEAPYRIQYWTMQVQFTIWAAKHRSRNGKDIAYELLGRPKTHDDPGAGLLKAFHDSAGALALEGQDRHIRTDPGNDMCVREDDDVWRVVLPLDVLIERRQLIRGLA